ncbi:MAG: signal peptidase I [Lachnospiraceae bacterium]|nr:signal peptidase I [Lachnospiraceae bacterium]
MRKRRKGLNFSRRRRKLNLPLIKEIFSYIVECAVVIGIAYTLVSFFGLRTSVVGNAMADTLVNDEQIFVNRFVYIVSSPKPGDVVVFLPNGNVKSHYYVRRVIAGPGDRVKISDGAVYVNGELFVEKTAVASIEDPGIAADEIRLGDEEYFVLGDNRNNSEDSRLANIGNVKKEYIIGKAWFHFESFGNMGTIR